MIKSVPKSVLAFDVEWVPDPLAGRLLVYLPALSADGSPHIGVSQKIDDEGARQALRGRLRGPGGRRAWRGSCAVVAGVCTVVRRVQ